MINSIASMIKREKWLVIFIYLGFLAGNALTAAPSFKYEMSKDREKLFPVPEVLKANVQFWKQIYAVYPSHMVLIHDSEDLSIVYEVVDLYRLFADPGSVSLKTQWKKIERIKKEYSRRLRSLARKVGKSTRYASGEKQLLSLFGGNPPADRLYRAARNIRGQQGMKEKFHQGLQRSGIYHQQIDEIFKKYRLPRELIMLPHVESSFNYNAYSKMGAAGIWQFTRGTGRQYMKINYDVDERLDPLIATEAAAKLLKHNYSVLKSWPLAITAYNHGLNGMKRAKRKFGDDIGRIVKYYRSRSFGFASRNFYAEFIAALEVATGYENYFGAVDFYQPREFHTFKTKKYYDVETILQTFHLTLEEFKSYNPALRPPVLRGQRRIPKGYRLRIPEKQGMDEKTAWASIAPTKIYDTQVFSNWYKVRRGDNLSLIARRVGVPVREIVEYNNLASANRIFVGQVLRIPERGGERRAKPKKPVLLADAATASPKPGATAKATPAEPGDGAESAAEALPHFELATGLAVPESEVAPPNMRVEVLSEDDPRYIIVPAREPAVTVPEEIAVTRVQEPISDWIKVEPEETLGHYADWLEIPTQRLRKLNHLAYGQELHIGQRLRLDFDKVTPEEFHRRRLEYQRSIEEDFFSAFSVEGLRVHRVKRGQSLWYITNRLYGVPLWLVMKYNPDRDLQNLHVGDEISIPIVTENASD